MDKLHECGVSTIIMKNESLQDQSTIDRFARVVEGEISADLPQKKFKKLRMQTENYQFNNTDFQEENRNIGISPISSEPTSYRQKINNEENENSGPSATLVEKARTVQEDSEDLGHLGDGGVPVPTSKNIGSSLLEDSSDSNPV
jgi:hypothetical protein